MTGYACSGSDSKKYAVVFDLTTHLYIHRYKKKDSTHQTSRGREEKNVKNYIVAKKQIEKKNQKKNCIRTAVKVKF